MEPDPLVHPNEACLIYVGESVVIVVIGIIQIEYSKVVLTEWIQSPD